MKRILLPTDFSECSWNAIDYAIDLFKDEACTFYLLHTYKKIKYESVHLSPDPSERTTENIIKQDAISTLEHIKTSVIETNLSTKHQFETRVVLGSLGNVIKDIVKQEKIDLVIMGTKGATGAKEVFMGSTTVQTVKLVTNCPILAVPEDFRFVSKPSEITFATDFNHFYSKEELQPLLDIALSFNATIRILYIQKEGGSLSEEQKFNLRMLQKYFGKIDNYLHTLTIGDSVASTLQLFSEKLDVYLVAMLHYEHSFVEKLTREPVIKNIMFHSKTPLLILPELGMSAAFSKTSIKNSKLEEIK